MAKYTSEVLDSGVSEIPEIIAKNGMKIKLKQPNVMDQLVYLNVVGDKDDFGNQISESYRTIMGFLLYVDEIDGVRQPSLRNKLLQEALIKKLGDDGLNAVIQGVNDYMSGEQTGEDAIKK